MAGLLPSRGWTDRGHRDIACIHRPRARSATARLANIDGSSEMDRDDMVGRLHDGIEIVKAVQLERKSVPAARATAEQRIGHGSGKHTRAGAGRAVCTGIVLPALTSSTIGSDARMGDLR